MQLCQAVDEHNAATNVRLVDETKVAVAHALDRRPASTARERFYEGCLFGEKDQHFRIPLDQRFQADLPRVKRHVAEYIDCHQRR